MSQHFSWQSSSKLNFSNFQHRRIKSYEFQAEFSDNILFFIGSELTLTVLALTL